MYRWWVGTPGKIKQPNLRSSTSLRSRLAHQHLLHFWVGKHTSQTQILDFWPSLWRRILILVGFQYASHNIQSPEKQNSARRARSHPQGWMREFYQKKELLRQNLFLLDGLSSKSTKWNRSATHGQRVILSKRDNISALSSIFVIKRIHRWPTIWCCVA